MTRFQAITPILLFLGAGCAPPPLCSTGDGCHDVAAEDGEPPPPDLPCGGADLLTDDANCGACGNACDISWSVSETPYSSGHCIDGQCGPSFDVNCGLVGENATCADLCQSSGGQTCVPRGCPGVKNEGVTALIYYGSEWTQCLPDPPDEEFTQDCDDPLPPPDWGWTLPSCCCL